MTTLRRTLTVLAGIVAGLCTTTMLASAAFAQVPPAEPTYLQPPARPPTAPTVADGSLWWVYALVAVGAAALTLAAPASRRLRHPGALGARGGLHPRRDVQFAQDAGDVDAGGPGADEQAGTDLVWLVLPSALAARSHSTGSDSLRSLVHFACQEARSHTTSGKQ